MWGDLTLRRVCELFQKAAFGEQCGSREKHGFRSGFPRVQQHWVGSAQVRSFPYGWGNLSESRDAGLRGDALLSEGLPRGPRGTHRDSSGSGPCSLQDPGVPGRPHQASTAGALGSSADPAIMVIVSQVLGRALVDDNQAEAAGLGRSLRIHGVVERLLKTYESWAQGSTTECSYSGD